MPYRRREGLSRKPESEAVEAVLYPGTWLYGHTDRGLQTVEDLSWERWHRFCTEGEVMYMIVGGRYQGKLRYAMRQTGLPEKAFLDGGTCTEDSIFHARGITGFHIYVRRFLMNRDGRKREQFPERLLWLNPDLVILSDEIGCGIVPMDEEERKYRETVGRVCTDLARRSARVDRVICGIGTVLKQTGGEQETPETGIHG